MPRYHNVDGVRIKFTKEEEVKRDIEEKQDELAKPLKLWVTTMKSSDGILITRELEEHIKHDHGGVTNSLVLKKYYELKKELRDTKPKK